MSRCQYDTGSMYGCEPACGREASQVFTYSSPCYGPYRLELCAQHVSPMAGRVYPDRYTVEGK